MEKDKEHVQNLAEKPGTPSQTSVFAPRRAISVFSEGCLVADTREKAAYVQKLFLLVREKKSGTSTNILSGSERVYVKALIKHVSWLPR